MGNLYHFIIVAFRYCLTALLVMCGLVVALLLFDIWILNPGTSEFSAVRIKPFGIILGIIIILFFVVRWKEKKIEASKKVEK